MQSAQTGKADEFFLPDSEVASGDFGQKISWKIVEKLQQMLFKSYKIERDSDVKFELFQKSVSDKNRV